MDVIFNILVFILLSVGGLCMIGQFNQEKVYFPLAVVICMLPLMLFMKYTQKLTNKRFYIVMIFMALLGIFIMLMGKLGIEGDKLWFYSVMLILLLKLIADHVDRTEPEKKSPLT